MATTLIGDMCRFSFSYQRLGTTTAESPDSVIVIHRPPSGPEAVYEFGVDSNVVEDSEGNFHADIRLMEPRRHYFRAVGESADGLTTKSVEEYIDVLESYFEEPLP